jgi:hypothetical protein
LSEAILAEGTIVDADVEPSAARQRLVYFVEKTKPPVVEARTLES